MKIKTAVTHALTATAAIVATYSITYVPPLAAIADVSEAHNYPTAYRALEDGQGEGWYKEWTRSDGKVFVLMNIERNLNLTPNLRLTFDLRNRPGLPLVLSGPQVGWIPANGDTLDWTLDAASIVADTTLWYERVLTGTLFIGPDYICSVVEE